MNLVLNDLHPILNSSNRKQRTTLNSETSDDLITMCVVPQ